jgi:DNA-binding transcriptional LysR family regulator
MTFTQIEILLSLIKLKNFSQVAVTLGLSQSAVSHSIASLEKELGVQIFFRDRTKIELTEIGKEIASNARDIYASQQKIYQETVHQKNLKTGTLKIGSIGASTSVGILPDLIVKYRAKYPNIQLQLNENYDEIIAHEIINREVELGFIVGKVESSLDLLHHWKDEFITMIPEGHQLNKKEKIHLTDLLNDPFILASSGCSQQILGFFTEKKLFPKVVYQLPQLLSILGFVQQGLGVAISTRLALPKSYPGVSYKSLDPKYPRDIYLVTKSKKSLSPAAKAFISLIR